MSQSALVTDTVWADISNYTKGRTEPIRGIALHHTAGTSLSSATGWFANPNANCSAHYVVKDNSIVQCVREEDTAWALGDWLGNCAYISIEVVNSSLGGDYPVSSTSLKTVTKLIAEIAKRNGLGKLWLNPEATFPTLAGHRDFVATICPGDYQYVRLQDIADEANKINEDKPAKAELKWSKLSKVTVYQTNKKTYLYGFDTTKASDIKKVKDFAKNELIEIYGKCENKTLGKTYLLTEYSYTKKIANGFLEADMDKYEASKPSEDNEVIVVPSDGSTGEVEDNPRGLTDAEYSKLLEQMKQIENNAKEQNVMIPMSNKVYDILKIVAIVVLPLIQVLYAGLSKIWGFGFGTEVDQTIQLIVGAINTILGLALVKSSTDYHKGDAK